MRKAILFLSAHKLATRSPPCRRVATGKHAGLNASTRERAAQRKGLVPEFSIMDAIMPEWARRCIPARPPTAKWRHAYSWPGQAQMPASCSNRLRGVPYTFPPAYFRSLAQETHGE